MAGAPLPKPQIIIPRYEPPEQPPAPAAPPPPPKAAKAKAGAAGGATAGAEGAELEALKRHVALVAGASPAFAAWLEAEAWANGAAAVAAGEDVPEDVEAAVAAQGAAVKRLKDSGLGNKDPEVAAAVKELLRLKALLPEPAA